MPAVDTAKIVQDYEIEITDANTEYSLELPSSLVALEVSCRDGTAFIHSFTEGAVDSASPTGPYRTVLANGEYKKNHLYLNGQTLYVACGSGSKVIEVRCWTV